MESLLNLLWSDLKTSVWTMGNMELGTFVSTISEESGSRRFLFQLEVSIESRIRTRSSWEWNNKTKKSDSAERFRSFKKHFSSSFNVTVIIFDPAVRAVRAVHAVLRWAELRWAELRWCCATDKRDALVTNENPFPFSHRSTKPPSQVHRADRADPADWPGLMTAWSCCCCRQNHLIQQMNQKPVFCLIRGMEKFEFLID